MAAPLQNPALDTRVAVLGVSPSRAELLGKLSLHTVGDLLFHFPRSYEDLTDIRWIKNLSEGILQTVQGEVVELNSRNLPAGGFSFSVVISDDQVHVLEGIWFNQAGMARQFRYGQRISLSGKVKRHQDHWQINNPRLQFLEKKTSVDLGIVPIYPLTENLHNESLRSLIAQSLAFAGPHLVDALPPRLRIQYNWESIQQSLIEIHQPRSIEQAEHARRRFIYEEFLILQVALALRRRQIRDREKAPTIPLTPRIDAHIRRLFPFPLTGDQNLAIAEICHDLNRSRPMQRLLQAEVGAGKTAVAVYALLTTVASRHQAVLMVPTETLARQHFDTLEQWLHHSRVRRILLTGGLNPMERQQALDAIASGEVDLVIGTQALLQKDVRFSRLGLVVIDEQHKFGVNQRARLRRLGEAHYLVMTATPIPRTVALTLYGDLNVTTIHELPPGRHPVKTRWFRSEERPIVLAKLRQALSQGRQAYIICPRIEDGEESQIRAAIQTHSEYQAGELKDFRLGLLHGRLADDAKTAVMQAFRDHRIDVLVSTTIVEVGIDVPNATCMLVEEADRYGLSQLHQLRGRVSRGTVPGICYLIADPTTEEAAERLRTLVRIQDGFALAQADLQLRGAGDLLGTRQHGLPEFRWADPILHADLLQQARQDALQLVARDGSLRDPDHQALRRLVFQNHGQTLDLIQVG